MALTTKPTLPPSLFDTQMGAYKSTLWSPSDTNYIADAGDKAIVVRGIVARVAGNIQMQLAGHPDGTVILVPIEAGVIYSYNPIRIYNTNTTATSIYVLE